MWLPGAQAGRGRARHRTAPHLAREAQALQRLLGLPAAVALHLLARRAQLLLGRLDRRLHHARTHARTRHHTLVTALGHRHSDSVAATGVRFRCVLRLGCARGGLSAGRRGLRAGMLRGASLRTVSALVVVEAVAANSLLMAEMRASSSCTSFCRRALPSCCGS